MCKPKIKYPGKFMQFHRGWKVMRWDARRPITGLWEGTKDEDITITTGNKNTLFLFIDLYEDHFKNRG